MALEISAPKRTFELLRDIFPSLYFVEVAQHPISAFGYSLKDVGTPKLIPNRMSVS